MEKTCGNCALFEVCNPNIEDPCVGWTESAESLQQRHQQLEQVAAKLVRAHYCGDGEAFKGAAEELAEHFDANGKEEAADHVHALAHPGSGIVPMTTNDALEQVAIDMFRMHEFNSRSIVPSTSRVAIDDWRDRLTELGVSVDD